MIKIYPYENLGHKEISWLSARHHFSFSDYVNPERMSFGKLRVINDDIIKAGTGFGEHPHRDMEIITYVRKGAISHKDNKGNEGKTKAGDVQVMSAGTGIFHSEFNNEEIDTNLYQIWIEPQTNGVEPRWDAAEFPKQSNDNLQLLVSGRDEDKGKDALYIHQQASIYGGLISQGKTTEHQIKDQIYILISYGEVEIDGQKMKKGDGAEVTDIKSISITALNDSEILIIDVPK
jgi:redox-sensitive bicupin YhaK (pirin superfamily)